MKHPTKPGQKCRIIDTFHGKEGVNINKEVFTRWAHPVELRLDRIAPDGTPYVENVGVVWRVSGQNLTSHYGAVSNFVDVPAVWLEVIDEVEPPKVETTEKEITA